MTGRASQPPPAKPLAGGTAVTPIAFVVAIVQAFEARHRSPQEVLELAQIAPADLLQPAGRISAAQMEVLAGAAMQALDDEALGWFARPLPWGSYGMLARASLSAPSLGVALKRWCRHHGLLTTDVSLRVTLQASTASITLSEHRPPGGDGRLREFCFVSLLRNIHGLACWLIDSRIPLQAAAFPFDPPPHAQAYGVLFDGPTAFAQTEAAIRFDARYLTLPVRRDETAMNQMLQRALPLTVHPYRRDRLLVQRVRQALLSQPLCTRNASELAVLLKLSDRTLHRQLREEGASVQALKNEVRRERATELLLRTSRPIKQVAQAAGFQNEKSFIRAFKSWTNQTPAEYRTPG